ncbi:MAG: DNA-3-methyladenine glycosylase 2 family protein [Butyrivibrio sp.]|nr:DNA-3-methyladenine glycosylase 2 family protein [Butyrivibrio sp.]
MIKKKIKDDFDLKKIAESGQSFRFNEVFEKCGTQECKEEREASKRTFSVTASYRHLLIRELGQNEYEFECSTEDYEHFWKGYFDLGLDYSQIRERIDKNTDPYLYRASEFGKGIRILKQDPWEMLISFIISQRKNIPAIKASIEKLCALAGDVIEKDSELGTIYSFPGPEKLAGLSMEELGRCSLGYRDKYVHQAALDVASGAVDLDSFKKLDDEALMAELLKLYGVGVKVANCEILFGYHRLNAFPRDVWINRVLEECYKEGFPFDAYYPYNGVMQQYLFFAARSS